MAVRPSSVHIQPNVSPAELETLSHVVGRDMNALLRTMELLQGQIKVVRASLADTVGTIA